MSDDPLDPPAEPTERELTWRVFLSALAVYLVFAWPLAAEIPLRYLTLTRALVEERTVALDGVMRPDQPDLAVREGQHYLAAAPGPAWVGVLPYLPVWLLGGSLATGLTVLTLVLGPAAGAAAVAGFYRLTELGPEPLPRAERLWLTAALGVGTSLFPLSTVLYSHALTLACATWAAWWTARAATPRGWALAGFLAASLPALEYTAALLSLVLGVAVLLRAPSPEEDPLRARAVRLGWFALGALLPVALLAAYHTRCFGAPWRTGYAFHAVEVIRTIQSRGVSGFQTPTARTLWEVSLGTARGALWFAPPLALALLTAPAVARREPRRVALGLGLVLTFFLLHAARVSDWYGGLTWGPRYQMLALPFGLLILASGARPAWARRALPWVVGAGALVGLLGVSTRWPQVLSIAGLELSYFGPQSKLVGQVLSGEVSRFPAGIETRTGAVLLGSLLAQLAVVGAWVKLWGRGALRPGLAVWGALVVVALIAVTRSHRRETAIRDELRAREYVAYVQHYDRIENFLTAADVAQGKLKDPALAADLARRALALDPENETAQAQLAVATGDAATLERLATGARDPAVRARARAGLGR